MSSFLPVHRLSFRSTLTLLSWNYARKLPKAHKDQMIRQKLDRIITEGIEVRLLTREEYFQRLKAKIKSGYKIFLFDPLKATTVEEIEQNEDTLWS